jgi:two-component system sensor histidine kinase KdpD
LHRLEERLKEYPVELTFPADLPPVYVDPGLVVQLFSNLLDNIAKYTPRGTQAVIAATAECDFIRVVVEDRGPGFPPGDPELLFEKFQRGSEEGAVGGAGLGLAICRAIVRAHGGEIEARRREGGGARFEITLPAGEPPP